MASLGPFVKKAVEQNNEDSILPPYPEKGKTPIRKLFLVCDGVGGSEKGEIASSLACESFQTFFSTFLEDEPTEEFVNKAVGYTEVRFDDYVKNHPEAKGMATTLTMVSVGASGITLAHIGDSRIYQFRQGEIIYQTEDHSLVNSLVKLGKISKEEALTHPQKKRNNSCHTGIGASDRSRCSPFKGYTSGRLFLYVYRRCVGKT